MTMSEDQSASVAIVGGGLLGLTAAYRLAQAGVQVSVYESGETLGGLAGSVELDGIAIDRYYHVVLPTDERVISLADKLGLGDRFRFRRIGSGFYQAGQLGSLSTARELLRFPSVRPVDRVRLGAFGARCQIKGSYDDLETIPLEEWLRKTCGNRLWEDLWRPLLDSKFDGNFDDLPATYLWARMRRMSKTRDRSSREVMGTINGGYQVLVDKLARAIRGLGGEVLTSTPVRRVVTAGERPIGVALDSGFRSHDYVVTTQLRPHLNQILPESLTRALGPDQCRYLGVVCLVARVRRPISPFYAINITDRRLPITTVVETTHVVDPEEVGGTLLHPEVREPGLAGARAQQREHQARLPASRPDDLPRPPRRGRAGHPGRASERRGAGSRRRHEPARRGHVPDRRPCRRLLGAPVPGARQRPGHHRRRRSSRGRAGAPSRAAP